MRHARRAIGGALLQSAQISSLSAAAERLLLRLAVVADEFGRFEADPFPVLKNCFPRWCGTGKWKHVLVHVIDWLNELGSQRLVEFYCDKAGTRYGVFSHWNMYQGRHQARYPRYPEPPNMQLSMAVDADLPIGGTLAEVLERPCPGVEPRWTMQQRDSRGRFGALDPDKEEYLRAFIMGDDGENLDDGRDIEIVVDYGEILDAKE